MGLLSSIEEGQLANMPNVAFVLTMIHHFGRTTGHQVCNLSLHFLLLLNCLSIKRRESFFTPTCRMLPRKGRGHNLSVLKYKLRQKNACLGNPVEVALPGRCRYPSPWVARLWLLPPWLALMWSSEARFALRHGRRSLSYPLPSVNLLRGLSLFVTVQSEPSI